MNSHSRAHLYNCSMKSLSSSWLDWIFSSILSRNSDVIWFKGPKYFLAVFGCIIVWWTLLLNSSHFCPWLRNEKSFNSIFFLLEYYFPWKRLKIHCSSNSVDSWMWNLWLKTRTIRSFYGMNEFVYFKHS